MILCIETSTTVCSAAITRHGHVIASAVEHAPNSHGTLLTVLIDRVLKSAGITPGELTAVAISAGPGSYTGLRIGTSVAKGLCFALAIPLIAIPSLEIMALGIETGKLPEKVKFLCPMMDARRLEVYTALYSIKHRLVDEIKAVVLDKEFCQGLIAAREVLFFGNGSNKFRELIKNPEAIFLDGIVPLASCMAQVAQQKFDLNLFEDTAYFEPLYLKEFVATTPRAIIP